MNHTDLWSLLVIIIIIVIAIIISSSSSTCSSSIIIIKLNKCQHPVYSRDAYSNQWQEQNSLPGHQQHCEWMKMERLRWVYIKKLHTRASI